MDLADDYMKMNDVFQAKATLQSIIDNYEKSADDPEDLLESAKVKLNEIQAAEKAAEDKLTPEQKETDESKDSIEIKDN